MARKAKGYVEPEVIGGGDSIPPEHRAEYQRQQDVIALNTISIPISELRLYLSGLTVAGVTEIPLGSLWLEINRIYREKKNE